MRRGNTRKGGVNWKRVMLDFKGFWKTRYHDDDERSTTLVKSELKVLYIYIYVYIYMYIFTTGERSLRDMRNALMRHSCMRTLSRFSFGSCK
jgi:hypothetical protein